MSGHSKWASIKHKKGAADAKRGQLFSRLSKEIAAAAKAGGGDPSINPRLRTAIQTAKTANMPNDNIDRSIKRGTGELPGISYEECIYEGYGPGGIAILVDVLTDNKNRTAAEIRSLFSKHNGNLAGAGSVSWIFEKRGLITVRRSETDEETLLMAALDSGAEDVKSDDKELYEIITVPDAFEEVKKSLEEKSIPYTMAELTSLPKNTVTIKGRDAERVLTLVEALEEHDDVQNVYANFDIPDDILDKMGGKGEQS